SGSIRRPPWLRLGWETSRSSRGSRIGRGSTSSKRSAASRATWRPASRWRCSKKRSWETRLERCTGAKRSDSLLLRRPAMTSASVETDLELTTVHADAPAVRPRAAAAVVRAGLVWTLIRTDFKARYHGSLGGFVWALLKPLSMFLVLMAVFSFLFASNPTYKLDLIIGLFLWDFFAEATKTGLTSLHAKGFLLTKARFPSWILVVTSISNAVITLGVFAAIITVFLAAAGRAPSGQALAFF